MAPARIRLLEADPDLARFLDSEDLDAARQLSVPLLPIAREEEESLERRLAEHGAFAALLLDGMVLESLQVGAQAGLRLLGPGDIITHVSRAESMLIDAASLRVVGGARAALLGREFLLGVHHWPALVRGLHLRLAQQADRVATQLVVCQLPRVDQRLLALMWLLAESWGRVTPSGTTLPLKLTHEALGALIGARRPTVTLALRDLSERGAIVRQDMGWLLLEAPPAASGRVEHLRSPALIEDDQRGWTAPHPSRPAPVDAADLVSALTERVASLRQQHERERDAFAERMNRLAEVRQRCQQSRARVAQDRLSRRPPRSS